MSDQFKNNLEFKGLVMRSVPDNSRELFKELAKNEFDNHYGLTLRELLNSYFEYQAIKEKFFTSDLDFKNIPQLIKEEPKPDEVKEVRNINGDKLN